MADLLRDGISDFTTSGNPDTATPRSNGASGSEIAAENVNGVARAVTELQTLLGNALTLKGSVENLATRLARVLDAGGSIRRGTNFPSTPTPQKGDVFYRTDVETVYFFNGTKWQTVFEGGGADTIDHGALGGLGDDDHPSYIKADGTRNFSGDQAVQKSNPAFRFIGQEAGAEDVRIVEAGGMLKFQRNTGTEDSPIWVDFFKLRTTSGLNLGIGQVAGPSSTGSGSTQAHEGAVTISSNTSLAGIHFYTTFALTSGTTITVPSGKRCLVIVAKESISIAGTLNATGAGGPGGGVSQSGTPGTDQPGGSSGNGGQYSIKVDGGAWAAKKGGSGAGAVPATVHGSRLSVSRTGPEALIGFSPYGLVGGSGGSGGGTGANPGRGGAGGRGGNGGGSIVLIAPTVTLESTAVITTNGTNGSNGGTGNRDAGGGGGGGGGGAGNVWVLCGAFTDNGATFNQRGGSRGSGGSGAHTGHGGGNGTPGGNGFKQILEWG